jgi:hypothetical protein
MCVDEKRFAAFSLVVGCPGDQLHLKMKKHGAVTEVHLLTPNYFIYRQYDICFFIHLTESMITNIQGDSVGKVNIFGGEKEVHMNMCLDSECLSR